jgi:UDP-N-acetyl-D-mannosaminuronic acid transferase (WecB/TagA/CpsF family)
MIFARQSSSHFCRHECRNERNQHSYISTWNTQIVSKSNTGEILKVINEAVIDYADSSGKVSFDNETILIVGKKII